MEFVLLRSFSLPDFVSEVQEVIRPVLNAYIKVGAELILECINDFSNLALNVFLSLFLLLGVFFLIIFFLSPSNNKCFIICREMQKL